ncbi:putative ferredoxin:thioredoxin reductase [Rosa chinensis]|uniref:Putative ferredoxin:thioredoxin reductase n=1 Tax=Rosa chinensis TaxID=74649 RepID=A0A2P6R4W2_ROSCH|nr:ferredoxin-thioredoxin reductase, variable chain, chloroplastic [Rosa chinensis]PRQ41476.1 putative ferredoxin:thioredoxin reductase [Rosa chinensis]
MSIGGGTVGLLSSATATATAIGRAASSTPADAGQRNSRFPCCWAAAGAKLTRAHYPTTLNPTPTPRRKSRRIVCEVAIGSDLSPSTSSEVEAAASSKIGARVKVTVPLKVYHVPRVPEVDITGMEGELKQYVGLWKGKRISANLPYKVQFFVDVEGRGPVKFFAHLKEDEFEYL